MRRAVVSDGSPMVLTATVESERDRPDHWHVIVVYACHLSTSACPPCGLSERILRRYSASNNLSDVPMLWRRHS